jgi:hypothetical protein
VLVLVLVLVLVSLVHRRISVFSEGDDDDTVYKRTLCSVRVFACDLFLWLTASRCEAISLYCESKVRSWSVNSIFESEKIYNERWRSIHISWGSVPYRRW